MIFISISQGEHQIENASTAVAAISINNKKLIKVINKGLLSASWAGRMQKLDKGNLSNILGSRFEIWLDGGHNIEASSMIKKKYKIGKKGDFSSFWNDDWKGSNKISKKYY